MEEVLVKVTIRIFPGDKERLEKYYQTAGYNKAIRTIVKKHLDGLDEQVRRKTTGKLPRVDDLIS